MSLPTRASLAMALAWAGGFGLPGPAGLGGLALAAALALSWWWRPADPAPTRARPGLAWAIELLALALLLGLLARTLGRVVIATPAAVWAIPIAALGCWLAARRPAGRASAALGVVTVALALAAGLFGAAFEARGPQPRGRVLGTPILGVHPRQAIAVELDGFGPHDIIADDYVDPPGGQGYDPDRWAARLEQELRAIAESNYAAGPARARAAFAGAEVEVREALVPTEDRPLYTSLRGLEVRSGTVGAGSTVEFVCPGQPSAPRASAMTSELGRSCPRKYLPDGSTGLGLASRFPGHVELIGRDRARLASLLGWPRGDDRVDRRLLALESGIWLLALVLGAWLLGRTGRREAEGHERRGAGGALVGAALLVLGLALIGPAGPPGPRGGPTLLAIALILAPAERRDAPALACALALALLAASPLAGHGDALALVDQIRERLCDPARFGLGWAPAGALAGSLTAAALSFGAAICAAALVGRARAWAASRDRPRAPGPALLALVLALVLGLALALRKPLDDVALLGGAAALVTLSVTTLRTRGQQLALALLASAAASAPILDAEVRTLVGLASLALAALLCVALGWLAARPGRAADDTPSSG